VKQIES